MTMKRIARVAAAILLTGLAAGLSPAAAQQPVDLSFYYPVAVGGPVTKIIDGLAADFQKATERVYHSPQAASQVRVKVLTSTQK